MTSSTPYPVQHAREIARRIDLLTTYLDRSSPEEAAQIMDAVLNSDDGLLGRLAGFMAHSSRYAQARTTGTSTHPDLWRALARGASNVDDLALDLDAEAAKFASLTEPTTPPPAALPARRQARTSTAGKAR